MPNMDHAAACSATLHYLKVAAELGVARAKADGREMVAAMKRLPTEDDCFGAGSIRPDGRKIHPMYLFEAKKPAESAFRSLSEGGCALSSL
jgi:branched-chain amino acid transport system substrate-binding protein